MSLRPDPRPSDPAWLYLACFVVVGLALGLLGPSVSALREQVGVDTGSIGKVFAAQGLGYLVGSQVAGHLYDRGGGHRVLTGGLTALSLAFIAVPAASTLLGLAGLFSIIGFGAATMDVGCNSMLVWSRGQAVGRMIGALHLCFGLGALVAPVISRISLSIGDDLWLACIAIGSFGLLVAASAARFEAPAHRGQTAHRTDSGQRAAWVVIAAAGVWFLLYVGIEVGFTSWIHTYGEEIELGSAAAITGLNVAVWVAFTAGRIVAVVVAGRHGPMPLLAWSAGASVAAAWLLLAGDGRAEVVWPAVVLYGLAVGPQFPMMMAHVSRHMVLSARSTSVFVGAAGLSSLTFPWLIGLAIDGSGPAALPRSEAVLTAVGLVWLVVVHRLITRPAGRNRTAVSAPASARDAV